MTKIKEYYSNIQYSLLNGWNFLLDELQDGTVYFYVQAQLRIQRDLAHPFFGTSWEKIITICERCGFSESKGYQILNVLEFFNFIKRERYGDIFIKRKEEIEKWNIENKMQFEANTFNPAKDFLIYLEIPKIPQNNGIMFKKFYNQESFSEIVEQVLEKKPKFKHTEFRSFADFKIKLSEYSVKNKLNSETIWKTAVTRYWKENLHLSEEKMQKIRLGKKTPSYNVKIFNAKYKIDDFSKPFSEEYIQIIKTIEKDFNIPIMELFLLFGRALGIKKDFMELVNIFEEFANSQRIIVMGFKRFISHCKQNSSFIQSRKAYFLKSLFKFIDNERNTLAQYNVTITLKPNNKHELDEKLYKSFEEEYGDEAKYFKFGYNCPNCSTELTVEDISKCPKCKVTLNWKILGENLELIKRMIQEHTEKRNKKHEQLLRKV